MWFARFDLNRINVIGKEIMDVLSKIEPEQSVGLDYRLVMLALRTLPDHCARNVEELAQRIGADKLELLMWGKADIKFARLLASKVCS